MITLGINAAFHDSAAALVVVLAATLAACTGSDADDDQPPSRADITALLARHGTAVRVQIEWVSRIRFDG